MYRRNITSIYIIVSMVKSVSLKTLFQLSHGFQEPNHNINWGVTTLMGELVYADHYTDLKMKCIISLYGLKWHNLLSSTYIGLLLFT